ncbi:hypothetical protein MsAg5_04940 [Methanosarcinaceae archaeon Ag5]|uniref:Radical SAM core domain-containing protein n=1 Tax=Methanolapillus africanus TaxID=3028297 RepID=A0AAE4MIW9_9EURY|nr:hypothetical protein [Methanosarcinaceae archaeon Ag5]
MSNPSDDSKNGIKKAMHFEFLSDNKVKCNLCARRCFILPGKFGFCRVRQNVGGVLYTLNYGIVSSKAIDPIEKKPVFHFLPGTATYSMGTLGCNFKCRHCQNWRISQILFDDDVLSMGGSDFDFTPSVLNSGYMSNSGSDSGSSSVFDSDLDSDTSLFCFDPEMYDEKVTPEEVIYRALFLDTKSISFTYNEPTIWYEFIYDTAVLAKENGLYVIMVTNGYMTPDALEKLAPYIDVYRVDIKAFSEKFYSEITRAKLEPVLESTKKAKELGLFVETVTLLIPGLNDDKKELAQMADWILKNLGPETPVHLNAFHPDFQLTGVSATPISTMESARNIFIDAGIDYVYIGNMESKYKHTYCPECSTLLINRSFSLADFVNLEKDGDRFVCSNCGKEIYLFDPFDEF